MRRPRTRTAIAAAVWLAVPLAAGTAGAQANKPAYDPRAAFSESDTNHDGVVDHAEFDERMTEVFFSADVNKDGFLTPNEAGATLLETDDLSKTDSSHDGKLTLHEFIRARMVDFEQCDTNDDGVLELDEVTAAYEKVPKK